MPRPRPKRIASGPSLRRSARSARPRRLRLPRGRKLRRPNQSPGRPTAKGAGRHPRQSVRSADRKGLRHPRGRKLRLPSLSPGKPIANGPCLRRRQPARSARLKPRLRRRGRKRPRPKPNQGRPIMGAGRTAANGRRRSKRGFNGSGRLRFAQSPTGGAVSGFRRGRLGEHHAMLVVLHQHGQSGDGVQAEAAWKAGFGIGFDLAVARA
jgi:hypothetical protein